MSAAWECGWFCFLLSARNLPNSPQHSFLLPLSGGVHWFIGCPVWRLLVAVKIQLIEQFTLLRLAMVLLLPGYLGTGLDEGYGCGLGIGIGIVLDIHIR